MTVIIQNTPLVQVGGLNIGFNMVQASVGRLAYIVDPITNKSVAGVNVTDYSANFPTLDITDNNSAGFRELLDVCGTRSIDFSISGTIKSGDLRAIAQENSGVIDMTNYKFKWADGSFLNTRFVMEAYSESFPTAEAATFSATIKTSGNYTIT